MTMTPTYITRVQARKIDERALDEYEIPGALLMENAGRGCVDVMCSLGIRGPVVICCGKGNNAGDGFVMARHLDLRGHRVKVLLWSEPHTLRGDAGLNYRVLSKTDVPIVACDGIDLKHSLALHLTGAAWVVDALLGTGFEGELRPPLPGIIGVLNSCPAKRLAVDLPSGLDCDTGRVSDPTFRADHTCTFVAPKIGFRSDAARQYLGQVHVLDIGAPRKLIEEIVGRPIAESIQ